MRCKACDSIDGKFIPQWEDYYCDECCDAIYSSMEDEALDELAELWEEDIYDRP